MVFSSISFLYYFLPAVLLIYHLLFLPVTLGWSAPLWRRLSNLFLLSVSLVFYFWGENFLIWIVLASTMIDYISGLLISGGFARGPVAVLEENGPRSRSQRFGLILSVVSNLSFLGFFKYFNFFVDNLSAVMAASGFDGASWHNFARVTLPLGISFYTFQSMSYTIDVYRGKVRAIRNLVDFACYVTMFPQLVAGPIVRYRDVAEQLVSRTVTRSGFSSGVERFVVGLAKKILIANTVAEAADGIFAVPATELTPVLAWLGIITYTLQIYFDFSGYSDMAIGLGRMFGFDYLENFNYPYIAQSVQDFWRRWHISLSTWFRDYLFIPLGGSRVATGRIYFNLVTVFFLCGLWHGAAWNFAVWGLFHGSFLVIERIGLSRALTRAPKPLRHLYTMLVVLVGWVLFRAETLAHALTYLQALGGIQDGSSALHPLGKYMTPEITLTIVLGVLGSAPLLPGLAGWLRETIERSEVTFSSVVARRAYGPVAAGSLVLLMLLVGMRLASGSYNPFIYFRF